MALKTDKKFEGKLISASKNDMRNLANFYQGTLKSRNWGLEIYPSNFDACCMA